MSEQLELRDPQDPQDHLDPQDLRELALLDPQGLLVPPDQPVGQPALLDPLDLLGQLARLTGFLPSHKIQ